jgi:hypothetical protein
MDDKSPIALYIIFIIVYISLYLGKGEGLWGEIEVYTPNWSDKTLVYLFIYLFVASTSLSWVYNKSQRYEIGVTKLNNLLMFLALLMFAFTIFALSEERMDEAFVLSTIILVILLFNILISFMFRNKSSKIFSILPLMLYMYIYVWVFEIKNNY